MTQEEIRQKQTVVNMKNYRERTCNFCDFSECNFDECVICSEEHHQEGKDRFQYYKHRACEYFKEEKKNDVYGVEEYNRERDRNRRKYMIERIENIKRDIKEKEEELEIAKAELRNFDEE